MPNTENIHRLIAYIDGIEHHIPDWGLRNCFWGMIRFGLRAEETAVDPVLEIANFFGVDEEVAEALYYMVGDPDNHAQCTYNMRNFAAMSLPQQKSHLCHALIQLCDTGQVHWVPQTLLAA